MGSITRMDPKLPTKCLLGGLGVRPDSYPLLLKKWGSVN